ncbi:Ig-like domain-containing protein [Weissella ceti]|uniref:Ig-like domain-containing protein n=1 Tax=Weissella ceti TaxID=759620 RepID=A0ABT3E3X6_9LACO|nr:Ig-like domain-containing protein [Weissella ceti]MCW0953120.1 Ig-like domain-containing protein [Weissella ceti]QVK12639.1 LPXTG cell wall anchor domain-containing protein [Weissella ceti]
MSHFKKTLFIIVLLLFGIFGINVTASAATDYGSQFLTNVTLINSANQNVLDSGIEVKDLEDFRLSYDFAYPDTVKPGDSMSVELPKVLKVSQLSDFDIKNADGVVVAKASFEEGTGKLKLTFTDRATEKQNNRGSFFVSTKWDQNESGVTDGPVEVQLPVRGTVEKHNVLQKGVKYEASEFSKFGEMDPKDQTIINYELQLNYNGFNALMENIEGGDELGAGLDYIKDSFEFVIRKNGQSTAVDPSRYSVTFTDNDRGFGFTMDKVMPDEELLVRYKTRVTDSGKAAEYDNMAWIRYDANKVGLTVRKKTRNTAGGGSSVGDKVEPPVTEPENKDEVTPDENTVTEENKDEVTPDENSVTEPENKDEVTPDENSVTEPENKDEVTPDENSVTEPENKDETTPDENSVTEPENKDEVTPDESSVTEPENKDSAMSNEIVESTENNTAQDGQSSNVMANDVNGNQGNNVNKQHKINTDALPETGYTTTDVWTVIGSVMLSFALGLVYYRKR